MLSGNETVKSAMDTQLVTITASC